MLTASQRAERKAQAQLLTDRMNGVGPASCALCGVACSRAQTVSVPGRNANGNPGPMINWPVCPDCRSEGFVLPQEQSWFERAAAGDYITRTRPLQPVPIDKLHGAAKFLRVPLDHAVKEIVSGREASYSDPGFGPSFGHIYWFERREAVVTEKGFERRRWAHLDHLPAVYHRAVHQAKATVSIYPSGCGCCRVAEQARLRPDGTKSQWHDVGASVLCEECMDVHAEIVNTGELWGNLLDLAVADHLGIPARPGIAHKYGVNPAALRKQRPAKVPFAFLPKDQITAARQAREAREQSMNAVPQAQWDQEA